MARRRVGLVVVGLVVVATGLLGLPSIANAQVETTQAPDNEPLPPPPLPAPPTPASPPPAAAGAATASAAPPPAETAEGAPRTMTFVLPQHRFEASGRLGVIGGGALTPRGLNEGHTQASWVGALDLDMITLPFNPFFTLGGYAQFTNAGYERFSNGSKINTDGNMTLVSFGASAKARLPLSERVAAKAGVYLGYNRMSFSVQEDGKTIGASGGGLNVAFTGELVFAVSRSVAINAQLSFLSQVAGSVTVDGQNKDHDLAFTPKPFFTVGPEFHF